MTALFVNPTVIDQVSWESFFALRASQVELRSRRIRHSGTPDRHIHVLKRSRPKAKKSPPG
jgi:hypothetical protein